MSRYRENKRLHGVIYIQRITDVRMGGISRRNFAMFRALCGEPNLRSVALVTNMWGAVDPAVGAAREHELASDGLLFKPVLDAGARMLRHDNTLGSARAIVQTLITNVTGSAPLQIQREIVDEQKSLERTAAGEELKTPEIREAERRQEEERRRQREAAEAAMREREAQRRRELEAERQRQAEAAARARAEQERIQREQEEARRREEERLREAQRAREAAEAARRAEEERLRLLHEEQARQIREAEEARARHEREMAAIRQAQSRHHRRRFLGIRF